MEEKKEKLVLDGNSFYELDLECLKRRGKREQQKNDEQKKKEQRD